MRGGFVKRFILLAIVCIVVDQLKSRDGWLTHCKGFEVDGEVVFESEIVRGQAVTYRPFIVDGEEYMHGKILGIDDPKKEAPPSSPAYEAGNP